MQLIEDRIRKKIEEWREREISAVLNSSPAIYLTKIGALDFLKVYKEVFLPEKVRQEIVKGKGVHVPDAYILEKSIEKGDIKAIDISNEGLYSTLVKNPSIHEADAEAIVLAEELDSILVMDDPKGIEVAEMRNIRVEPTLTVLLAGYSLGSADFERTESIFKTLLMTKFRVSAREYEKAIMYLQTIKKLHEPL